jgi:hypothetical protein
MATAEPFHGRGRKPPLPSGRSPVYDRMSPLVQTTKVLLPGKMCKGYFRRTGGSNSTRVLSRKWRRQRGHFAEPSATT